MNEIAQLLVLPAAVCAVAVLPAAVAVWCNQPTRRLRRRMRNILGADLRELLAASRSRRGVAFNFRSNQIAVAWDHGRRGLLYGIRELTGVQVIVNGQVAGFGYRGKARWPYHLVGGVRRRVALRLTFDDPVYPDFTLELWRHGDSRGDGAGTPEEALAKATYWLARFASLLNRPRHSWWEAQKAEGPLFVRPAGLEAQTSTAVGQLEAMSGTFHKEHAA